jgi:hypothetical protein
MGTAQSIEDNESTLSDNSDDTVGRNTSSSVEQVQEFVLSSQSNQVIIEANREWHTQPTYSTASDLCEFMFCVVLLSFIKILLRN